MDTSFMNFHGVEHFSLDSYFTDNSGISSNQFDDASNQSNNNFAWDWQNDRDITGEMGLLPTNTTLDYCELSTSPYNKEEVNKMLHEWQQFINIEDVTPEDIIVDFNALDDKHDLYKEPLPDIIDNIDEANFDITTFVNQVEPSTNVKSIGPGGKKIDMLAQRYVTNDPEDDHVDVETISEHPSPVLEACDVNSLLEQFEAETKYNLEIDNTKSSDDDHISPMHVKEEDLEDDLCSSNKIPSHVEPEPILNEEGVIKGLKSPKIVKKESSDSCNENDTKKSCNDRNDRHKQIIESLPQELINRIKQCSKRKPIAVIPAKPSRKRGRHSIVQEIKQKVIKQELPTNNEEIKNYAKSVAEKNYSEKLEEESLLKRRKNITTDHDYCVVITPYPKQPLKDSGFESAEEDDKYNVIKNQPTYRNSDGKMMVSILKSNAIRNNISNNSNSNTANINGSVIIQRKKLNLEEYKKRRDINFKSSASNSPLSSGRNSPQVVEDENTKRLRHQELLMKMASAILKPVKKENKSEIALPELPNIITQNTSSPVPVATTSSPCDEEKHKIKNEIKPPSNFEVKTIVSVATNTDESWGQLKDISPILQNINVKIDSNSLIASVIENIPKVKTKVENIEPVGEHGEDKTIVYLDKNRPPVTTCNVYMQTDLTYKNDLIDIRSRRGERRRNSSTSSRSSSSSSSSSTASSRSRSTSPVNKTKYKKRSNIDYEKVREVEERRVVYVGRINDDTTREELKKRFEIFGPITNVSVHFRNFGDNYGFVTFIHKLDAYEAVEHGNDNPDLPRYDLSFGGRRMFCKTTYADLDNVRDEIKYFSPKRQEDSFDTLLREFQAKIRRRKF